MSKVSIRLFAAAVARRTALAVLLLALPIFQGASAGEVPGQFDVYLKPQTLASLPDGRRINFVCMGEGGPTAVLDAGAGNWSASWRHIQPDLAKITRVCAFDRPGFGFSDPGPTPREAAANVKDLRDGLRAAGIRPPYVLVGHSAAGLRMLLFAYTHPDEVSGLLLIDPEIAHAGRLLSKRPSAAEQLAFWQRCEELSKAGKLAPGGADDCVAPLSPDWSGPGRTQMTDAVTRLSFLQAMQSEQATQEGSSDAVDAARRRLGDMPVIVLTQDMSRALASERKSAAVERDWKTWVDGQAAMASDTTRGQHRKVEGAGHAIWIDRPDAVLDAFREIVDTARRR